MDKLLVPINDKEFKRQVIISFDNINQGFDRYKNNILTGKENAIEEFLRQALILNGSENSFVDFYYWKIDDEGKERLYEMLSSEGKELLSRHIKENSHEEVYFRLSKESLPLLCELNAKEILFSTFYFTKFPLTLWGNYDKRFPCFYEDDEIIKKYRNLGEKCGVFFE